MTPLTYSGSDDHLWRCAECGTHYPVQPMARACEARHEREEQEVS